MLSVHGSSYRAAEENSDSRLPVLCEDSDASRSAYETLVEYGVELKDSAAAPECTLRLPWSNVCLGLRGSKKGLKGAYLCQYELLAS